MGIPFIITSGGREGVVLLLVRGTKAFLKRLFKTEN